MIEEIKNIMKKKPKKTVKEKMKFLNTGSTLLNLAISDKYNGGYPVGVYSFLVGDSSSGKTFLSLTCFAEACQDKFFKDHRLIYDNSENGALMNIEKFFGKKVLKRIEQPNKNGSSQTVEEFYYNLDDVIKEGKPFIYVLDSMDGLSSNAEIKKFEEQKEAFHKNKTTSGSYGDHKAKINAGNIRKITSPLNKLNSILIIINQTRDNISGFGFEKKTRSGGHALRFYNRVEIWSSPAGRIKKTVNGKPRQIGINAKIDVKRNQITGKETAITIPIYHSYGIDDIGSCIDFLLSEKHWSKSGNSINAKEFNRKETLKKLIEHIENNNKEKELRKIVGKVWKEIQDNCSLKRKKRYE